MSPTEKKTKKFEKDIMAYLGDNASQTPVKPRRLAREMGVAERDYGAFRQAYKQLRAQGRLVLGGRGALLFPNGATTLLGRFRSNPRGFGFVVPEDPAMPCDVFVPAGQRNGAQDGDLVWVRLVRSDERDGQMRYTGEVTRIEERGDFRVVGSLTSQDGNWVVIPDGKRITDPVLLRDVPVDQQREGTKVVADIIWYPDGPGMLEGALVRVLGPAGDYEVELAAVMAAFDLDAEFSPAAQAQAARVAQAFTGAVTDDREDLRDRLVVTIDPDDAKDYDDAISLRRLPDGWELGVHIADVSAFVEEGSLLDVEAKKRGFSVYFPRRVVPMLPQVLSNGVCSLQEGVPRYAVSALIRYDAQGAVRKTRFCRSVIQSAKRLTYRQAQAVIDGADEGVSPEVAALLRDMDTLARRIVERRNRRGMIHLDLPEIELEFDDAGKVVGAHRADDAFTHTIIEMFMVEANEAVASFLHERGVPAIRRIHPPPDEESIAQLRKFLAACGYDIPETPSVAHLAALVERVRGNPVEYAVNMAVLRSFQKAMYSVETQGHFALGSAHYAHFTSPIRRYPDLVVHRMLTAVLAGETHRVTDDRVRSAMVEDAVHFSAREQVAQSAETQLRLVLVLQHLAQAVGQEFEGVVCGVADFGVFVQHPVFLIEGLVRIEDLGDDWWMVSADEGKVVGEYSGTTFRIGQKMGVRIEAVDVARRQLVLARPGVPSRRRAETGTSGSERAERPRPQRRPPSARHGRRDHRRRTSHRPRKKRS